MSAEYIVCNTAEIPGDSAKGFSISTRQGEHDIFIVHKNDCFYAYKNSCPHTGVNLEWKPDEFLNMDKNLIQCSTHGAQFRIENGYCIYGPCQGRSLTQIPVIVNKTEIKIII